MTYYTPIIHLLHCPSTTLTTEKAGGPTHLHQNLGCMVGPAPPTTHGKKQEKLYREKPLKKPEKITSSSYHYYTDLHCNTQCTHTCPHACTCTQTHTLWPMDGRDDNIAIECGCTGPRMTMCHLKYSSVTSVKLLEPYLAACLISDSSHEHAPHAIMHYSWAYLFLILISYFLFFV